jgi:hypothetical protein
MTGIDFDGIIKVAALPITANIGQPPQEPPMPVTPFDAFKALTRKLVRVPKADADKKESEYKKRKRNAKDRPV